MINICLVDDHILLRDALEKLINGFENCNVLFTAGDGNSLFEKLNSSRHPDIVILDLNMPVMNGYEAAEKLKRSYPKIRILILTMYDSDVALIRLLQTGVRGFLKKDIHPSDLNTAINLVANDGYYYCNNSTGKISRFFTRFDGRDSAEKLLLSEREIQFLQYACSDLTYKEIAHEMKMTPRVIDACRDELFEKIDVKSRVGLAIFALKNGLVVF